MNQYDGSGDEDQSEDGLLRSPDNDFESNEEDTTDSLDIKPPQAAKGELRYKGKKIAKDKKHSRDDKHKDRDRIKERGEHKEQRHRGGERERIPVENRHHAIRTASGKVERELIRYEPTYIQQQQQRERDYYKNHKERVSNREKLKDREQHRLDRDHQQRSHDRRKDSPDKSESDRALEDLRSRLLSKRNKLETEKRVDDQRISTSEEHYDYRRMEKDINRYEYEIERRKEKDSLDRRNEYYQQVSRDHRERKDIIELIDSPENYNDIPQHSKLLHKENRHSRLALPMYNEDKEQAARRAKLLEAEREMARRKVLFREELEARRELRRERDETKKSKSSTVSEKNRKRQISFDKIEDYKKLRSDDLLDIDKDYVVTVTDNSEQDTETDSDTTTNSESKDISDGELPGSPLSIGELTKSDLRRRSNSRSISRSRSHSISSQSETRSLSRSKSLSPDAQQHRIQLLDNSNSRSPQRSRSRSKSPCHQFKEDYDDVKDEDNEKRNERIISEANLEIEDKENKTEILSKVDEADVLPSYYPALQGCRSVEEFQCLNRIEEGTYGVVYRAKDKRTEEIVALKRLKMEKEKEGFPITSLREINTLLKGQHPNIVTVREIVVGSNMDKIFIVMDYVEHDLKSLMETMKHKKQAFLPGEVKCLLQQLLRAVAHLHDNWILHRDLKTSNLLLSHKGILKVGDFGLAREYGSPLKAYTSIVVTLWYRAPELLLCCKEYSTPIDIWSVGCIFAELMSMAALFPGKSEIDQLNRIFKDLGTPNEKIWCGYNELPAVQKMTFTEYPVSQLRKKFAHLTSELGLSLLQGLLTYDPKQRLTADQGLRHSYFKELPLAIDPGMFPTWPAKSELGARKALASSPKPPSGGGQFKQLVDDGTENHGFNLGTATMVETRQLALGGGFSLKF